MTPEDDQHAYLEKYKLLVQFISYQGIIFWTVFSIFMAANAIMFSEYFKNFELLDDSYKRGIPLFGIFISIFWLLVSGRDITLRQVNIEKAKRLLKLINNGSTSNLEIWSQNKDIEGSVRNFKSLKGLSGIIETVFGFLCFIYLIVAVWVILSLRSWGIESLWTWIGIPLLALIFCILDYKIRKNAINEFRKEHKSKKNESKEDANMGIEVVKEQLNGYRAMWGVLYAGLITGMFLSYTHGNLKIYVATIVLFFLFIITATLYYRKGKELAGLEPKI